MKKILIIDDDQFMADIYSNRFRSEGYEADVAGDANSAMNRLKSSPPDVVLLDLMLPDSDGVEVHLVRGRLGATSGHAALRGAGQQAARGGIQPRTVSPSIVKAPNATCGALADPSDGSNRQMGFMPERPLKMATVPS
jgi:hypothetical protein